MSSELFPGRDGGTGEADWIANPDHVEMLSRGVVQWNQWLSGNKSVRKYNMGVYIAGPECPMPPTCSHHDKDDAHYGSGSREEEARQEEA